MVDPRHGGVPGPARFIGAVFGFVFAAIGVTVIAFLWGAPFDDFHSPPLFFRIVGSLIAVVFVAAGGTMGVTALRAKPGPTFDPTHRGQGTAAGPHGAPAGGGGSGGAERGAYRCPNCGAPLGASADVSPSGDVKCTFCGRWFSIHRAA